MNEKATIIEMVLFKTKDGIPPKDAQKKLNELNGIVSRQDGFIFRRTALSKDGQYIDLVYWTDLRAAQRASENVMNDPKDVAIFSIIDSEQMIFKHFEVFNRYQNQ
jgi:hypothetical protein